MVAEALLNRVEDVSSAAADSAAAGQDKRDITIDAWAAYHQGDVSGAVQLWKEAIRRRPRDPGVYLGSAVSHRAAGSLDAVEEILGRAARLFPKNSQVLSDFAWIAVQRRDWPEAVDRWKAFRAVTPDVASGYFGASIALRGLDLFDEADALICEGLERIPDNAEIHANYAWNAHTRKDWPEAHRRWAVYHQRFPDDPIGYSSLGVALRELDRFDESNSVLTEGLSRFPDHRELIVNSAWVSYFSGDWPEALQRWTRYRDQFPDDPLGHRQVMMVLGELGQFEELDHLSARPAADDLKDPEAAKLMFSFESLGDNCEFGVVQRHFGAEPLGLLRFTATPPVLLKAALEQQLTGIGDPENTRMHEIRGEYVTNDNRFHMAMHTFIRVIGDERTKRFEKICQRIRYLRDKILSDLQAAEKHFVYGCREKLPDDEIRSLWQAMRAYGDNRLLFVCEEVEGQKAGSIRVIDDGLIVGCVDRLSVDKPSFNIWRDLCQRAYDEWTS